MPMPNNAIAPAIDRSKFTFPHCAVTGPQAWFNTYADRVTNHEVPLRLSNADLERVRTNLMLSEARRAKAVPYWEKVMAGGVFLDRWVPSDSDIFVANLTISARHNCEQPAIWLREQMVYPD